MKTFSSILILFFAFNFSNAQDITVNADTDPAADFTRYKTFSLVDRDDAYSGMDQHQKDHQTDRADGERTGSGYGTQGATGTTREQDMTGDQTTRDRDQGMTEDETTRDRDTGVAGDPQAQEFSDREDRDRGIVSGQEGVGTTDRDREQGMTGQEGTSKAEGDHKKDKAGKKGTYGATGDHHKSHAKANKKNIKEAIKAEMEKRGYTYTESNPDLLVNFLVFEGEGQFSMGPEQNTYSAWGPQIGQADQLNIEEGTIVVHLVDTEQNRMVYQAFASVDNEENRGDEQQVKEVVSRMFEEIPEANR